MKRYNIIFTVLLLISILSGCGQADKGAQIVATTLPVYEFTVRLCQDTDIQVTQLITENVSCLHDYTLQVSQMRAIESAQIIVTSGAGLENFLEDALQSSHTQIDSSEGIPLLCHEEGQEHGHGQAHHHEHDPHIWLSPENAKRMARNICSGLAAHFPQWSDTFRSNLANLESELDDLSSYGADQLSQLSNRELITFHDGFSYMADAFDLTILEAIEEESGSEASAAELISLINLVEDHNITAIFTERNGSASAASVIASETGVKIFTLDMAISGESYFEAMYHNIDTLKEALE